MEKTLFRTMWKNGGESAFVAFVGMDSLGERAIVSPTPRCNAMLPHLICSFRAIERQRVVMLGG